MMHPLPSPDDLRPARVQTPPPVLDEASFDALFRESSADVHGYVISLLGDRTAAEDVTSLAFERLYRSRARIDTGRGSPRALLFAIARNAALDELRRRKRHPDNRAPLDICPSHASDPEEEIERAERRAVIRQALLTLPPRDREVVLLKFHGQLSNSELGHALGISPSNAGTRLHRALTRLRDLCEDLATQEVA